MGVQRIACCCAHELPAEDGEHERGVDAVAGLGLNGVYGGAVGDLRRLLPEVDAEGLDDWASDGGAADEGTDEGAD